MMMSPRWVLLALLLGVCACAKDDKARKASSVGPSRGWGDRISWVRSYEEGLTKMEESQKPLMVIHHLETCPHCQALKKAFVADKNIQRMAKEDFVMVNVVEETTDKNMSPDGHYVPRILFVDPTKTVRLDIVGEYSSHYYAYEPKDMALLANNMRKAKAGLRDEL